MPVDGGGERFLLESRACGTKIKVASDNPKLQQLATGPLYDIFYYVVQLIRSIELSSKPIFDQLSCRDISVLQQSPLIEFIGC